MDLLTGMVGVKDLKGQWHITRIGLYANPKPDGPPVYPTSVEAEGRSFKFAQCTKNGRYLYHEVRKGNRWPIWFWISV
jgi:hypothetical protein